MSDNTLRRKAAAIFVNAAAYIRKYGWQIEGMGEHGKPRCSMGALASAYPKEKWEHSLAKLMYRALSKELHGMTLTEFNHKFKNGDTVAKLFEQTAKHVRA